MDKFIYIITLVSLCAVTGVHTEIRCYVCEDCPLAELSNLQTCGTTTTTSTTTPSSTTDETSTSTESSTTSDSTTSTERSSTVDGDDSGDGTNRRFRRNVEHETLSEEGCNCYNGTCQCKTDVVATRKDDTYSNYSTVYQCYKNIRTENARTYIDRGYKAVADSSLNACNYLNDSAVCYWCNTDKCNSASSVHFSAVLLISTVYSVTYLLS